MKRSIILALALFAACGSSTKHNPDANRGIDAVIPPPTAAVVAGDFTAGHPGILSTVDTMALTVMQNAGPAGSVGDDPVIRHFGAELFVVNRADGNNVTILDAQTRQLVMQLSTGAGSNPQDVAVKGNKLYAPIFGGTGVAVLTRGSNTVNVIDLGADDPDGHPDCVSNYLVGNTLYVACELLDASFQPRGLGKVYLVNTATDTLAGSITMQNKNPFGIFIQLPSGDLAIPTVDFATNAGCVEKITTGATPASGGCLAANTQMSGYAAGLDVSPDGTALLIAVSAFDFMHANIQGYDLTGNTLWPAPISPASEMIVSLAACPDGTIVAADSTMTASGVRIYRGTTEITTMPLAVGLRTQSANSITCF
jgi:hypothetical protein